MGGAPQRLGVLASGLGLLGLACAATVELRDGRWRAPASHASILDLRALEPGWERTDLDGPLLAFESGDGSRATWLRRCPGATASSRAEARALLVAIDGATIEAEDATTLAGDEAWWMRGRVAEWDRSVALKTVTRAAGGCTDDFILVTPALAQHEAGFDRWWASYAGSEPP